MAQEKVVWIFNLVPGRLMVGLRPLEASVEVRILSRQHAILIFENLGDKFEAK